MRGSINSVSFPIRPGRVVLAILLLCSAAAYGHDGLAHTKSPSKSIWFFRADSAQATLQRDFWNPQAKIFYSSSSRSGDLNYWWQAHALDVLVDGFDRTDNPDYVARISSLFQGVSKQNDGFTNNYDDDMAWMALALLRAYRCTGDKRYKTVAESLWDTIKEGWDANLGGGVYWQRNPHTYKNTPANAPACILACRLYDETGDSTDLEWAEKIHFWLKSTLVDTATGVVWDGIDTKGRVSRAQYSYNYGTYLDACLELYRITRNPSNLNEAVTTAKAADSVFASGGVLRSEGTGDGGLFNGIYVQYLVELTIEPDLDDSLRIKFESFLYDNAVTLWERGQIQGMGLFNDNWNSPPSGSVNLSVELSGLLLLEAEAKLSTHVK